MAIYVFDLDKTLCVTHGSLYEECVPLYNRIEKVNKLYDEGNTIIIDTARGNTSGKNWFYFTLDQLKSWGLKFHSLRTGEKFNADYLIDDKAIHSDDFFEDGYLSKESGSGTQTKVILVNRVYKEATDERMDKLIDEITFIDQVPQSIKHFFPNIISYNTSKDKNKVFYEMEHYNLPTLRRLILSGELTSEELVAHTEQLIINIGKIVSTEEYTDIDPKSYIYEMHYDRINSRLKELAAKSSKMAEILQLKEVVINGVSYPNINKFLSVFLSKENLEKVTPDFIGRWSHADLHYSNVLIDRDNSQNPYKFIDPRGYPYCDIFYDYGKIWHSLNGKYEFISSYAFELDESTGKYSYDTNNPAFYVLDNSKEEVMNYMKMFSNFTAEETERRVEFNEVAHFISLLPFMLVFDEKEEKAVAAYYTALLLLDMYILKWM